MITSQSFALEDFSHYLDDITQNLLDDSTQKLLDDISELPTGQVSIPINEGRTELVIEKAKNSTIHFGKLLEEYVLTKHSELINTIFSNEIINAFSVKDADLKSDFLIVKYNGELHVRSFVASSDSEQKTPRLHLERLGLRLFGIITNHINENKETLSENVPFEFIGKQFKFTYD